VPALEKYKFDRSWHHGEYCLDMHFRVLSSQCKEVLAVLTSNRKEALAPCRIQALSTRKKLQEVARLWTQKEVLAHALLLSFTVTATIFSQYRRIRTCLLLENTSYSY